MEWALINFRVRPQERQQLRVALLQQGRTLQDYFAAVVERELDTVRTGRSPETAGGDDNSNEDMAETSLNDRAAQPAAPTPAS